MKLLITLLASIPLLVSGQSSDSVKNKRIAVGVSFSADRSYRTLKTDNTPIYNLITHHRDSIEVPKLGFTTGINLSVMISKRFSFETGILYANRGERTKETAAIWVMLTGSQGIDPNLPQKYQHTYSYTYLDIPLRLTYYFFMQRVKLFVTAGVSPSVFLEAKVSTHYVYEDNHEKRSSSLMTSKFAGINLIGIAGFGVNYNLSGNVYLKFEPICSRSITAINDTPVKSYLYSTGFNAGVFYKL
jgi:hypothetical protein